MAVDYRGRGDEDADTDAIVQTGTFSLTLLSRINLLFPAE